MNWETLDVPTAITNGLLIAIYVELLYIRSRIGKDS